MTSPDVLTNVRDGDFVGEFRTRDEDGTPVPVVAVYKGEVPEDVQGTEEVGDVDIYRFRPLTTLGDESSIAGPAFVVAAVEHPHEESDGHTHAGVAVVAGGVEPTPDTAATSVFRDGAQFKNLLDQLLVKEEHPDQLDVRREDINLSPEGAQRLGFSATGRPDVLTLELQDDHELAAAA